MTLSLSLLGSVLITWDGEPVSGLTSKKAQALLAYLAVEAGRVHHRQALAGLLWPDYSDRAALASLRRALSDLRRAIGEGAGGSSWLLVTRETLRLNPAAGCTVDTVAFEQMLSALNRQRPSDGAEAPQIQALQSAIALYRGPFLEGFSLDGSPAFEEWLLLKREQFNRQVLRALQSLADLHEVRCEYDEALGCAWRAIELEPWQEEAYQQAMRLLALSGRRSAALAQYEACRRALARELGVAPAPTTTSLYESICAGTFGPGLPAPRPAPVPAPAADFPTAPFVAREHELATLDGYLRHALAGEGRIALVTGEAGSGKTSLLVEFARRATAAHSDLVAAAGRCHAYSGLGDPYLPFRQLLRILTGDADAIQAGGALLYGQPSHKHEVFLTAAQALAESGPDLIDRFLPGPALAARVAAFAPWRPPARAAWQERLEALAQRRLEGPEAMGQADLFEQYAGVLRALARRQPLLLALDDLQWADAGTLSLLFHLARGLASSRILIVGAYRSDEVALGQGGERHPLEPLLREFQRTWGEIRVDLARVEGRAFVDALLDAEPNALGAGFRDTLYRHTGGNALFTVELVRAMQERGDLVRDAAGRWSEGARLAWEQLPPRIEGAIAQRVEQLTAAQQALLETASVEGEYFYAEVLACVHGLPVDLVIADLSGPLSRQAHLTAPTSLVHAGDRQGARYCFRHGLFQSYLYGRLDAVARVHLHGAVGNAIEALHGEQAKQWAPQLARHYEAAGQAGKAAVYLLEAGRQAAHVAAHREAVGCFERALELLAGLPDDRPRAELELSLQMALDQTLIARGWGTSDRLRPSRRAYELGQRLGWTSPAMMHALWRLATLRAAHGEFDRALDLAAELLAAAERAQDPLHIAAAHNLLGRCRMLQGEFVQAQGHLNRLALLPAMQQGKPAPEGALLIWANAQITTAFTLYPLGYPDQARQAMESALAGGDSTADLFTTAYAQSLAGLFYALRHEDCLARQWAEATLCTIAGREMPEVQAWAAETLGWVEARSGHAREGIARMTAAIAASQAGGTELLRFLQMLLLAEAHLAGGETGAALEVLDEALVQIEEGGTRYCEAELWRLRGDVLLATAPCTGRSGTVLEAESCFRRACEAARRQGARLWELRATMSLSRLQQDQGRVAEAKEALTGVYRGFSEGFDTPDLVEAGALLRRLGLQTVDLPGTRVV